VSVGGLMEMKRRRPLRPLGLFFIFPEKFRATIKRFRKGGKKHCVEQII
jgi:hypothetical protein